MEVTGSKGEKIGAKSLDLGFVKTNDLIRMTSDLTKMTNIMSFLPYLWIRKNFKFSLDLRGEK